MRLRPGASPWADPDEHRPRNLGPAGEQLWTDVTRGWRDLTVVQLLILQNAAHTADLIDRLEVLLGAEELVAPQGPRRLVIEELQLQWAALVQTLENLELSEDGPDVVMSEAGEAARRAVRLRWAAL